MTSEAAQEAPREGSGVLAWAAGASLIAACADLLVAVLLGLLEPSPGAEERFTTRDLGPCFGAAAFASFAAAALAWRATSKGLAGAAAMQAVVAGALWWLAGRTNAGVPRPAVLAMGAHALAFLATAAAAGLAKGTDEDRAVRGSAAARAGAENVESILVAIVFALAIRHFAVEAYKIPTASMSPTLLGDDEARGPGDRVLVSKWPTLFGGPGRWQIWVFRPPLDRTVNYVKRVVGLPGETVEIRDGDLFVDGKVARKPPKTREEMWFRVWPRPGGGEEKSSPWSGEGFRKVDVGGFRGEVKDAPRLLRFGPEVFDAVPGRGGSNRVGDVRLRIDVEDVAPGTELVVKITGRAGPCEARISADGSRMSTTVAGKREEGAILPGGPVESLEVSFADLRWEMRKNGDEFVVGRDAAEPSSDGRGERYSVAFGIEKGAATFRNVRLDRDVYYTGDNRFQVPEGHYLFLGDNSAASQDSRMWRGHAVSEKAPGGRTWYSDFRPRTRAGRVEFRDRDGIQRSLAEGEVLLSDATVDLACVPLADLHGRAFAIFWPPRWFTRVPGGRVRVLP